LAVALVAVLAAHKAAQALILYFQQLHLRVAVVVVMQQPHQKTGLMVVLVEVLVRYLIQRQMTQLVALETHQALAHLKEIEAVM
jgi:hypothetical protein